MLLNLFGSQSRFNTSNAEEKQIESFVVSSGIGPRYPKRKREVVKYDEINEDEFLHDGNEEDEYEPMKKRSKTSKSNKPLPKREIFPFMQLPAELRNRIYGYALSDNGDIFVTGTTKGYRRRALRCTKPDCFPQFERHRYRRYNNNDDEEEESTRRVHGPFSPSLLAVSKDIQAEAASFLYTQRIVVADNYALLSFLNQIGPQYTSMLREVSVKEWCAGRAHRSINFPAMTLLANATNLERLNIDCRLGYFSPSWGSGKKQLVANRVARKVFRDCYPWLEAIGKIKGKVDAGIEMIEISRDNFDSRGWRAPGTQLESIDEELEAFRKELRRLLRT